MHDHPPTPLPTGRDITGAWLVCALIAVLALGFMNNGPRSLPAAASAAADVLDCRPSAEPGCSAAADAMQRRAGTVAGLHDLTPPARPQGEQHPHG
jgi:hypothetical protein